MKFGLRAGIFLILSATIFSGQDWAQTSDERVVLADGLFQAGKFADAREIYVAVARKDPQDAAVAARLGQIALLANKLDEAQMWLEKAVALHTSNVLNKIMLAEVWYRRNEFYKASELLAGVNPQDDQILKSYATLNAAKLASFKGLTPYQQEGLGETTPVKFLKTEPLPLVHVRVNGGREVIFFIDTGDSELLLDSEFAKELGVKVLGSVQGTFAGGQHAEVLNGRIDSVTLGDWKIKNLPVGILPLRSLSEGFGVQRIDGCIGTNLLYQFLSTIDYPSGELILRKKTPANLQQFEAAGAPAKNIVVPMWLQGDHYMIARGQVEKLPPVMLFVDSGLAGAGVKLAESVTKQAGIKLQYDKATIGAGGGGELKIVPYTVGEVSLGNAKEQNVPGLYDGPFSWEDAWGFHVAGMVGHDFLKRYAVTFDFVKMRIFLR